MKTHTCADRSDTLEFLQNFELSAHYNKISADLENFGSNQSYSVDQNRKNSILRKDP